MAISKTNENRFEPSRLRTPTILQRFALRASAFTERWFPDTYVIALLGLLVVCIAAAAIGASPTEVVSSVGDGYWSLIPFTYQMAMIVITGYAVAVCKPVRRAIVRMGNVPRTGPGAIAFVVIISSLAGLINWSLGLLLSTFLVMALVRRDDLVVDIRAAAAAALLGTAGTAMLGLSSAPALLHATPESVPAHILAISGEIPLTKTLFTWQNGVLIIAVMAVATFVGYVTAPRGEAVRTASDLGIDTAKLLLPADDAESEENRRPGDWLTTSPLLTVIIGVMWSWWIVSEMLDLGPLKMVSNLNNYIFIGLTLALLLHWRIKNFLKAVYEAVPLTGAILIQFPIYAAVASVITLAKNDDGNSVATYLSDFFIGFGGAHTLPLIVGVYSIFLGIFMPSAGAKWILEAPYLLHAGNESQSNLAGW